MTDPNRTHDFHSRFSEAWSVDKWGELTVLVAISGGADSVALLRLLHRSHTTGHGQLIVAHFNHGWRDDESNRDAQFVESLADKLHLDVELGHSDRSLASQATRKTSAAMHTVSLRNESEATARQERYAFLKATALRRGARHIVTAHTYDDQVETVIHRLLRGTGIHGLAGIPRHRRLTESLSIVRPLLTFNRDEIESYLRDIGQDFRSDASNLDSSFTRNRIRHELLPLLRQQFNPQVDQALHQLARIAREWQDDMSARIERICGDLVFPHEQGIQLHRDAASHISGLELRESLRTLWQQQDWPLQSMGAREWRLLESIVHKGEPRHANLPGKILVTVDSPFVRIERRC